MYQLEPLPYTYQALEPFLSARTLNIHQNKHHKKYVDNLNMLLEKNHYDYRYSLEELVYHMDLFPLSDRGNILFNLGGVLNHNLYFETMGTTHHEPQGELLEKIKEKYQTIENFKEKYIEKAKTLQGSGYTFLVLTKQNELDIINTPNQDTPYSYGMYPIMTLDLWEHAYYLDYQNNKDEYIHNFFQWLDFERIYANYQKAKELQQTNL